MHRDADRRPGFLIQKAICVKRGAMRFPPQRKKKSNGVNLSGSYTEEINMNLLLFPPRRSHTGGGLRASCLISVALRDTGIGWWEIPVCLSVSGLPPPPTPPSPRNERLNHFLRDEFAPHVLLKVFETCFRRHP